MELKRFIESWPGWALLAGLVLSDLLSSPISNEWCFWLWIAVVSGWFCAIVPIGLSGRLPLVPLVWLTALGVINWPNGLLYTFWGLFCLALFTVGKPGLLRQNSRRVGVAYFAFVLFSGGNTNIQAMNIWLLFFLSSERSVLWSGAAISSLFITGSEGGIVAMIAGLIVERWGWRWLAPVGGIGLVLVTWLKGNDHSVLDRLTMWGRVVSDFSFFGHGFGVYQSGDWHQSHNLAMETAQIAGWPGLLALIAIAIWVTRRRNYLTDWSGLLAAFAVHSLVDNPHYGVPGAVIALILGNIYIRGNQNGNPYRFTGLHWLPSRIRLYLLRVGKREIAIPDSTG